MSQSDQKASVQFTEEMKGYVTFGATNLEDGFKDGKAADTFFMFHLTIKTDDAHAFVENPEHEAEATGCR
jgi:cholesterol oxidase